MPEWLVEFEGHKKLLADIADSRFQAAVSPARRIIEVALDSVDAADIAGLQIIFWVDPDEGLKFTLRGPSLTVNIAIDAIGPTAAHKSRVT